MGAPLRKRKSDLVQEVLMLRGKAFDIDEYPYLRAVYDTAWPRVNLFTGRQVSKSTTLASLCVVDAILDTEKQAQVVVTPLQDQAYVFSTQRLHDFIHDSPVIKRGYFTGPNVIDQVLMKRFANDSILSLGYAQRTADRLRGRSAGKIKFDEFQDILPEVIPVIEEMAFRVAEPSIWKCGTPKSKGNHMEGERDNSTACEWAVRCEATGCKKWNLTWDHKNIGKHGVICQHCGAPLNTDRGQWVAARKLNPEAGINSVGYRIPQLIIRPIMSRPNKWAELLFKLRNYPQEQFLNEVLGLAADNGSQPVTLDELRACCVEGRPNQLPDPNDRSLPPLVMGFDWAFAQTASFSAAVIGGWNPFPSRFDVYYYKVFRGPEADPHYQTKWIIDTVNKYGIKLVGSDFGMGYVQNLELINRLGEEAVAQMWHTPMRASGSKASRAVWEPKRRKWHLARTAVLTDTFQSLRTKGIRFPAVGECDELFSHIMAETMEYHDVGNILRYTNAKPDDLLHALTFSTLAGELLTRGDFGGHLGSQTPNPGQLWDDASWNEETDGLNPALYG